jgi:hypothetical protein
VEAPEGTGMMSNLELLKYLLGFISIIGATVSGIAALLVEYKVGGKITKWGRRAIAGLAVSFLVGASNLWVDYTQKSRESNEAARRTQEAAEKTLQIITSLNRTLNPMKEIGITFYITFPSNEPELAGYRRRLDKGVRALIPQLAKSEELEQGISRMSKNDDGTIATVAIRRDSSLFPNEDSEPLAYTLFTRVMFTICFFKNRQSLTEIDNYYTDDADLAVSLEANDRVRILYNLETKVISLSGYISKEPRGSGSGDVVSVLDLPGAQMTIEPNIIMPWSDVKKRHLPSIDLILLRVGSRKDWFIPVDKLRRYNTKRNDLIYEYMFPATFAELVSALEVKRRHLFAGKN